MTKKLCKNLSKQNSLLKYEYDIIVRKCDLYDLSTLWLLEVLCSVDSTSKFSTLTRTTAAATAAATTTTDSLTHPSKQPCLGSWNVSLLLHNLNWKCPRWLAVTSTSMSMSSPGRYLLTMTPFAYRPPGDSCSLGSASQGSPQMPHLPPWRPYWCWKKLSSSIRFPKVDTYHTYHNISTSQKIPKCRLSIFRYCISRYREKQSL